MVRRTQFPLALGIIVGSVASAGGVESFWIDAANGFWNTPSRWTAPGAPGIGPRTDQTAVIDAVGAAYTIQSGLGSSLAGLRLQSADATIRITGNVFEVRGSALVDGGTIRTDGLTAQAVFNDLLLGQGLLDFTAGAVRFDGLGVIRDELRIGANPILGNGSLRFESGARFVGTAELTGQTLFEVDTVIAGDVVIEEGVNFRRSLAFETGAIARLRGTRLTLPSATINLIAESGFNSLRGPSTAQPAIVDGQIHVNSGATAALISGFTSSLHITADAGSVLRMGQSNSTIDNRFVGGSISSDGEILLAGRNIFSVPIEGDFSVRITGQTEFHTDQTLSRVLEFTSNIVSFGELRFRDTSVGNVQAALIGDQTQSDPNLQHSTVIESSATLKGSRLTLLNRTLSNSGVLDFSAGIEANSLFINEAGGSLTARSLLRAASALNPHFLNYGSLHLSDMGSSSQTGSVVNLTNYGSVTLGNGQRTIASLDQHAKFWAPVDATPMFGDAVLHADSETVVDGNGGLVRSSSFDPGTITEGLFHIGGDLTTGEKGQLTYRAGDFHVGGVLRVGGNSTIDPVNPSTAQNFVAEATVELERTELRPGGAILGFGTVRFTESLDWHGGMIDGSGLRIIDQGAEVTVGRDGDAAYLRTHLENEGTINLIDLRALAPSTWRLTNHDGGSIVAGADIVRVSASSGGTRRFEIINHGDIDLSAATETHLGGGFLGNSTVFVSNHGTLTFGAGVSRVDTIDNRGTITLSGGSLHVMQQLRLLEGSHFVGDGVLNLAMSPSGTHTLDDAMTQFSGRIDVLGNTHFLAGLDTDAGLALASGLTLFSKDVAVRGEVSVLAGTKSFVADSTFSDAFLLEGGSVITSGAMRLKDLATVTGGAIGGAGDLVVLNRLDMRGGSIDGTGDLIVSEPGVAAIGGMSSLTITRDVHNLGLFTIGGSGDVNLEGRVENLATMQIQGGASLAGGGSNAGSISVQSGARLSLAGDWSFENASTLASQGALEFLGGQFAFGGENTLDASDDLVITDDASVRVSGANYFGETTNSGSLLLLDLVTQVFDGYAQTQASSLTLAASTDGTASALDIVGDAHLSGALTVAFESRSRADTLELLLIEAANIEGMFTSVSVSGLPKNATMTLTYTPTSVVALVTVPTPASWALLAPGLVFASRRLRVR